MKIISFLTDLPTVQTILRHLDLPSLLFSPRTLSDGLLNKVVLLASDGTVVARYRKARPVPGPESWYMLPGDGEMAVVDTPFGGLGIPICFDLE